MIHALYYSCQLTFGVHAQRGLQQFVCLSVCLSVCRRLFWHYRLRGGLLTIPAASELREPEKEKGDFPETTVFERYAVKTSEKVNLHIRPLQVLYRFLVRPPHKRTPFWPLLKPFGRHGYLLK